MSEPTESYICRDFSGRTFLASENLAAALDRETVRSPVNIADAREIHVGQVWRSLDTGNRWRVVSLTLGSQEGDGKVTVERLSPRPKWEEASGGRYTWHPGAFAAMVLES
jgi:hypothetical protein